MGRRHLLGLSRAGFDVSAWDPSDAAATAASAALEQAGLGPLQRLSAFPSARHFAIATFAEPAPERVANLSRFLAENQAERLLLEKPLTCRPEELSTIESLIGSGVGATTFVDLPYRFSALNRRLKPLADASRHLLFSLVGGAVGLGCNGVHYLDMVDYIAGGLDDAQVRYAALSPTLVASTRGDAYRDYGGSFVLEAGRTTAFVSLSAESSAAGLSTIRGDNFSAWLDENDQSFRIHARRPDSSKPPHLYGRDYELVDAGRLESTPLERVSEAWARGQRELPGLNVALRLHRLLFRLLEAGGARPPYSFT